MTTYKKCLGCNATLWTSDPDICERCDLHGRGFVDTGAGRREAGEDFSYAVESEDEWL